MTVNVKNNGVETLPKPPRLGRRRRSGRGRTTVAEGTVVTYLRVSTSEQALSGLGIDAQRARVAAYAERKGLTIVGAHCDEGISAKSLNGRPAALAALEAVRSGQAAGLLVVKMDRLSRSVVDGAGLMEHARHEGWALHFADSTLTRALRPGKWPRTSSFRDRSTNDGS
jgi:DNA invertase Pin-like site-specific DNA recombinase